LRAAAPHCSCKRVVTTPGRKPPTRSRHETRVSHTRSVRPSRIARPAALGTSIGRTGPLPAPARWRAKLSSGAARSPFAGLASAVTAAKCRCPPFSSWPTRIRRIGASSNRRWSAWRHASTRAASSRCRRPARPRHQQEHVEPTLRGEDARAIGSLAVPAARQPRPDGVDSRWSPRWRALLIVALGIAADGQKHALGLWEGSTENATLCQSLLANLQSRGLRTDRSLL
jgi:Transposase, Mutator family